MLAVTATVATQDNFNNTLNNKRTVPKSGEYFSALGMPSKKKLRIMRHLPIHLLKPSLPCLNRTKKYRT